MRHTGRDVEKLAGMQDHMVFQPVAIPGMRLAGEAVDRRLVVLVHMRLGAHAGRHGEQMHADALGADRFGGNAGEIAQALLAVIGGAGLDDPAGGF
ncbi:hypothetical protein D3C87_1969500 [compost metagenome]